MAYPYSKAETIADGVVHAAGLMLALPASVFLILHATETPLGPWPSLIYVSCMLLAFIASAVYHMTPGERLRPVLHRIDHAAIYLKIAGTYTPLVAAIGTGFAYGILGLVWALAVWAFWQSFRSGAPMPVDLWRSTLVWAGCRCC